MKFSTYLIETAEKVYATKYTIEEINQLPTLSGATLEGVAKVGNVVFDQVSGLGAVPNNQNVVYRGFVGMMLPKNFELFAQRADRGEDAKNIQQLIKEGYGIGSPFLVLKINNIENIDKITLSVVGHEGRARCVALNTMQPGVVIPIHFILYGETRARHLNSQIISLLNDRITAEGTNVSVKNKIKSVWINGRHVTL
jgi:hypothetical protein